MTAVLEEYEDTESKKENNMWIPWLWERWYQRRFTFNSRTDKKVCSTITTLVSFNKVIVEIYEDDK